MFFWSAWLLGLPFLSAPLPQPLSLGEGEEVQTVGSKGFRRGCLLHLALSCQLLGLPSYVSVEKESEACGDGEYLRWPFWEGLHDLAPDTALLSSLLIPLQQCQPSHMPSAGSSQHPHT